MCIDNVHSHLLSSTYAFHTIFPSWFHPLCLASFRSSFFSFPFTPLSLSCARAHACVLITLISINFTPINTTPLKTLSLPEKRLRFAIIEEHITDPETSCDNTTIYSRYWRCSQLATFAKEGKTGGDGAEVRRQPRRPLRSIRCRHKFSNELPSLSSEKGGHPPQPACHPSSKEGKRVHPSSHSVLSLRRLFSTSFGYKFILMLLFSNNEKEREKKYQE